MEAVALPDGVILLKSVVPADQQESVVDMMLSDSTVPLSSLTGHKYHDNPFLAFCQLFSLRWNNRNTAQQQQGNGGAGGIPAFVADISREVHKCLYGDDGVYPDVENGCSEDHQGRPCSCADQTPQLPRSTNFNCVEALAYRADTQRGYHRDANWMVGLSFGCDVRMGFRRRDEEVPVEVVIPSGNAVLFNGALHQHAVLGIVNGTAPSWWKYPFSRVVFLMRDSRQSYAAQKRRAKRAAAALEGGRQAAAIAAATFKENTTHTEHDDSSDSAGDDDGDNTKPNIFYDIMMP